MNNITIVRTILILFTLVFFGFKIPLKAQNKQSYKEVIKYCKANPIIKTSTALDGKIVEHWWVDEKCIIGAPLPIFETKAINGKNIDAAYFKNKMTIISFWFKDCPTCTAKIPALNKIKDEHKDQDINFLAIGPDSETDIESFIKENPFNFDLVANGGSIIKEVFQSSWGYPLTIIVNKKGIIIDVHSGGKTDAAAYTETIEKIAPLIINELGLKNSSK